MAGGILGTAVSGLMAFQRSLDTTGHNIANANTDGYSRQRVDLATRPAMFTGGSYLGQGVNITNISRSYDQFLTNQVRLSSSAFGEVDQYQQLAGQVDNILADSTTGMSPAIKSFFNAVHTATDDPTSIPARQVMLSEGEIVVKRFNTMNSRFESLRSEVNKDITLKVEDINKYAAQLADLNYQISVDIGRSSGNQQPNDLLDQRDLILSKLSLLVDVAVVPQSNGMVSVFIGQGQALVLDKSSSVLTTQTTQFDPTKLDIAMMGPTGPEVITSQISGGSLKGTLRFRDEILDPAQQKLGSVAAGIAMEFNAIHSKGFDLDGNGDPLDQIGAVGVLGSDFFKFTGTAEVPVIASSKNIGNLTATATFNDTNINPTGASASDLDVSDYVLQYDGANYSLMRVNDRQVTALQTQLIFSPPDPVQVPPTNVRLVPVSAAVKLPGIDLKIDSATLAVAGDEFLIRPTYTAATKIATNLTDPRQIALATNQAVDSNGNSYFVNGPLPGDNRNGLSLVALENKTGMMKNTGTFQDAYGQIVSAVGTLTHSANVSAAAQETLLNNAKETAQNLSGVNLDEEAANLMKFQQAYQAAAQVISISKTMFDSLISAAR